MITLASGASRTLKLLPALARHSANWGVPLSADTFKSLRSALKNASGDEIVREVLASSGRDPPLIACRHFMSGGGKRAGEPFPHPAGDCIGHAPLSGLADAHDKMLANECDSVNGLQLNPAWTSAASDPLSSTHVSPATPVGRIGWRTIWGYSKHSWSGVSRGTTAA